MSLRPLAPGDLDAVVALNNGAVPAVPPMDAASMGELLAFADLAIVAEEDGAVAGFLVAIRPGSAYGSENYRWFAARGTDSLYVDRIVVGPDRRGSGIGRALYGAVFDRAREEGRAEVTCEVNLDPPNPGSLAFHARLGFEGVGEQSTKGGAYTVRLLAAPVQAEGSRP